MAVQPKSRLRWSVRILLALVLVTAGILAGVLIRGKNGTVDTPPAVVTAQRHPVIATGCLAIPGVYAEITQAGTGGPSPVSPRAPRPPGIRCPRSSPSGGR
jgi:hypothetical protein